MCYSELLWLLFKTLNGRDLNVKIKFTVENNNNKNRWQAFSRNGKV